jgi:branched-chain amino acid transport system permease protein
MLPASIYATQALHGVVYGMLIFLVASGLTLVFGMLRILNMAHAALYMLGAYLAFSVVERLGSFWLALVLAPLLGALLGALIEGFLLRRTARLGHASEMLLTFGLFFMLAEAVLWVWGRLPLQVSGPAALAGTIPLLGGRYPVYRLFILTVSTVICAAMAFLLARTRIGIIIRSTVSDAEMVSALGIDTRLVRLGVFSAGSALAAFAGAIAGPFLQADPLMGMAILIDAFVVVVLGGFGSLLGALVGALMVGLLQSFGILWIPELAQVFQLALMAVVLVIRPQGLFGERG